MSRIAVLDIGKTNAKLALLDAADGRELWSVQRPNRQVQGIYARELDVAGILPWLEAALHDLPEKDRLEAIVPVAHGAGLALLDEDGGLLTAPDYEDPVFDHVAEAYRAVRDPYRLTLSPDLPLGLNLGRQLFFVQEIQPELFARAATFLTWAQFWTFILSGVRGIEPTSMGAHTDLWEPRARRLAPIVRHRGWDRLMPPLVGARDAVGTLRPELAARTGLPPAVRVLGGIHDSNCSYWRHRAVRPAGDRFAVVSTGTWIIVLAAGASLDRLDEQRDMLANVDATGTPTAATRFMGGREYAAVAGEAGLQATPSAEALARLVAERVMVRPSFSPTGGPFPGGFGAVLAERELDPEERATLATLYTALLTDVDLDLLGHAGEIVIEGPFALNPLFAAILARLRPADPVRCSEDRAGTLGGAWLLASGLRDRPPVLHAPAEAALPDLAGYRAAWRAMAEAAGRGG